MRSGRGAEPLDVNALEHWLAARPPKTLLASADRLLIASVDPARPDRMTLRDRAPQLMAAVQALSDDALSDDATTPLVLTALLGEAGFDVRPLRAYLAPMVAGDAMPWREPWRSAFLYWRRRAGLGGGFASADLPTEPLLALYHRVHVIFYAARYGASPVSRVRHESAMRACEATLPDVGDDADAVAELLLAEACLTPADNARRARLLCALGQRQDPDGSLSRPRDAPLDARHHTACVVALAASLVIGPSSPSRR